jgi:hypothetical protein
MNSPAIDYINLGFSWFMVLVSIWGYIAISRNKQQKWGFWFYFGLAWTLLGISYIYILNGINPDTSYVLALQIAGYVFIFISILSLMIRTVNREW